MPPVGAADGRSAVRGHEFWNERPWAVRREERAAAPLRETRPPMPVPEAYDVDSLQRTGAGLPKRPGRAAMRAVREAETDTSPTPRESVTGHAWEPVLAPLELPRDGVLAAEDASEPQEAVTDEVPSVAVLPDGRADATPPPVSEPAPESGPATRDDATAASRPAAPVRGAGSEADSQADLGEAALAMLAVLAPHLDGFAADPAAEVRATFARCHGLLARAGKARSDRRVWRALLTMADADLDAGVRRAADEALTALEHHGTLPVTV